MVQLPQRITLQLLSVEVGDWTDSKTSERYESFLHKNIGPQIKNSPSSVGSYSTICYVHLNHRLADVIANVSGTLKK